MRVLAHAHAENIVIITTTFPKTPTTTNDPPKKGAGLQDAVGGVRRSTRDRHKPLEYWRGEAKAYGRAHKSECVFLWRHESLCVVLWFALMGLEGRREKRGFRGRRRRRRARSADARSLN